MTETQLAVVFKGPGEISYEERPVPKIEGPDDVLIKSFGSCICGSDVEMMAVPQKHPCKPDVIFGHEFSGQVVAVGSGVTKLSPGNKVIVDSHAPCGRCDNCLAGLPEACEKVFLGPETGFEGQALTMGVFADGGLTSYLVVPQTSLYKVGPDTRPEEMALAESLAACAYAIEKLTPHVGDTAAILGAGPCGLMFTALLKASGCRQIIVSEPIEYRRRLALELGATSVVNSDEENAVDVIMRETDGAGVDIAIEAVGGLIEDCIEAVRPRGKVLQYGHDETVEPEIKVGILLKKEVEIHGGFLGKYYIRKVAQIISSGLLPLDKILTHTIPASKYHEALELAESRQCGKVFVSMDL